MLARASRRARAPDASGIALRASAFNTVAASRRCRRSAARIARDTRAGAPAEPACTSFGTASHTSRRCAAAHTPRRLPSAGFPGVDSPIALASRIVL